MIVGWNKPLKVLQAIAYVYFIGKDPLRNTLRRKITPVFVHFGTKVNSSSNHHLFIRPGEKYYQVSTVSCDRGYNQKVRKCTVRWD